MRRKLLVSVLVVILVLLSAAQISAQGPEEEMTLQEFMDLVLSKVLEIQEHVKAIAEVAAERREVAALERRVIALETTVSEAVSPKETPTPLVTPTPTDDLYDIEWCARPGTEGLDQWVKVLKPVVGNDGEFDPLEKLHYLGTVMFLRDAQWLGCPWEIFNKRESYVEEYMKLLKEISGYCNISLEDVFSRVESESVEKHRANDYRPDIATVNGVTTYIMMRGARLQGWVESKELLCPSS